MFGCDSNAANNSKLVSVIGAKNLIRAAATAANSHVLPSDGSFHTQIGLAMTADTGRITRKETG
jgi:hypothetical protein